MNQPGVRSERGRTSAVCLVWLTIGGLVALVGVLQAVLVRGHPGLAMDAVALGVYAMALASSGVVGTSLVLRRDGHPVGWAFLALAASLAAGPTLELYARFGALAERGRLPGADVVAHVSDPFFLTYFVAVAVALHLTPTGRPLTRRWGLALGATIVGAAVGLVGGLLNADPIDPPFEQVSNPVAPTVLRPLWRAAWLLGPNVVALGLVVAGASLVVRFRRSTGVARRQLLWMSLVAAPLPIIVTVIFVYRNEGSTTPLLLSTAGFIVLVPVAAGLSITRFHLYDVDRILSRTFSWTLLSVALVAVYASTVTIVGDLVGGWDSRSRVPTVLGTLAAASAAGPVRRLLQDALDRQFDRRRHDALAVIREQLGPNHGERQVDDVLREALGDPDLVVCYWIAEACQWVTGDGGTVADNDFGLVVERKGARVARLDTRSVTVRRDVVEAAGRAALTELDNARLRAALAVQLADVRASRTRLAAAQLDERRRIERDLHDGAQQRLLALALDLRAAQINDDHARLRAAVARGIDQTQATVLELRDLAHGLNSPVLADGGLPAALDDLTGRLPLVTATCPARRYRSEVESVAWFTISEAVANAVKHASARRIEVTVSAGPAPGTDPQRDWLTIVVSDDGQGSADPLGSGLQGLRDRIETAGGTMDVASPSGAGTRLMARLPCES